MAGRHQFPDVNDRSANAPSVIASADKVLDLYNRYSGQKAQRVSEAVRTWFTSTAINRYGWTTAEFSGNQCVLMVDMGVRQVAAFDDTPPRIGSPAA